MPVPKRAPQSAKVDSRKIMKILPETFGEAQARPLAILPPKFTDKHLTNKKSKHEKPMKMEKSIADTKSELTVSVMDSP